MIFLLEDYNTHLYNAIFIIYLMAEITYEVLIVNNMFNKNLIISYINIIDLTKYLTIPSKTLEL